MSILQDDNNNEMKKTYNVIYRRRYDNDNEYDLLNINFIQLVNYF